MLARFLALVAAPFALAGCATTAPQPAASPAPIATLPQTGLVSSADPRATQAGMAMLERGGSATDAAIAVMLALTVVEPQSSGIGGGGFYLRTSLAGDVVTIDGRETAPAGADPEWFLDADGEPLGFAEAVLSGLSVGVPANLDLAAKAHAQYGTLPWADLFAPAIALARDGFVVTERLHTFIARAPARAGLVEAGQELFFTADGAPVPVGTRLTVPALADTLEALASEGPQWLYDGPASEEMAAYVRANTPRAGGMTTADITGYEAIWRDPVCGMYRVYRICGMGPPSSGATTVFAILKQLEGFDLAALGPDSPVSWHLFAESQRLAYADRELYLADGDYVAVPVAGLVDETYLRGRGALIDPASRMASVAAGRPEGVTASWAEGSGPDEAGTSHLVAVDAAGNAVTYTSTIEGTFGSGLMFGGFYLNNELTDFSFVPEADGQPVANRVEGGKRPRSSMSPTLVFGPDGTLRIAIGAAGGGTIPVQVAKALIGVLDWDLPAEQAIGLPALYSPGDTITVEAGSALVAMQGALEALGHTVTARGLPLKANAVEYRDGRWSGAADPRSEGTALGR